MRNPFRVVTCLLGVGLLTYLSTLTKTRCLFKAADCGGGVRSGPDVDVYAAVSGGQPRRTLHDVRDPATELPPAAAAAAAAAAHPVTTDTTLIHQQHVPPVFETFEEALRVRHKVDPKTGAKVIVMSSLDSGYIEMGLNLWESSFVKFDIENYLFVCTDEQARLQLAQHGLSCFQGKEDKDADKASAYGTAAFVRKTHLKTEMTLQALRLGYTVLLVDVDIVFLKNPFPYFTCEDCDIQIQSDGSEINSGFLLVKPTQPSIVLHQLALKMAHQTKLSNQKTIARTLEKMQKEKTIKVKILSDQEFPRGSVFFEHGRRMFFSDPPCKTCAIVHNNWIVSGAAKIYRFKELLMWMVDFDGYYSNPNAKYLAYNNPIDFKSKGDSPGWERAALRTALRLGFLLNRTVILPEFHCYGCSLPPCKNDARHCSLNTYQKMSPFDKHMKNRYREHAFLHHYKVPESILTSQSGMIQIRTDLTGPNRVKWKMANLTVDVTFTPANKTHGATPAEILRWFSPYQNYSVLNFHSLYNAFLGFSPQDNATEFEKDLEAAMVNGKYRQY